MRAGRQQAPGYARRRQALAAVVAPLPNERRIHLRPEHPTGLALHHGLVEHQEPGVPVIRPFNATPSGR